MYHGMWNYKGKAPMMDKLKQQKNVLLITRKYLKKAEQSLYWKSLSVGNTVNENWNTSTREKDWMLRLGD